MEYTFIVVSKYPFHIEQFKFFHLDIKSFEIFFQLNSFMYFCTGKIK